MVILNTPQLLLQILRKQTYLSKFAIDLCALISCAIIFVAAPSHASEHVKGYAIFTLNPDFKSLSKSKARMLYRGRVKTLKGQRIELSDWSDDHETRKQFYRMLLGKDQAQMNAHWASLSFSGKARPPKEIQDDSVAALVDWLNEKSNRIGYAPISSLPKNANVLYVVKGGN